MIAGCTCAAWCAAMHECAACGRVLTHDEVALTKKLINRGARVFFCIPCLAAKFEASEEELHAKIVQFKEMGCTLFDAEDETESH